MNRNLCCVVPAALMVFLLLAGWTGQCAGQSRDQQTKEFDLAGDKQWLDTGMDVRAGDTLRITAAGTVRYPMSKETGPEGTSKGWMDLVRIYTMNDANRGALIARIGEEHARPFLIGAGRESRVTTAGRLYLGINQANNERPDGGFHVKVELIRGSQAPAVIDESKLPVPTQAMLDMIPARVADAEGNWGDRVNFLIVGSEDRVKQALKDAGWVVVNRTVKDAIIQGALATFSRQAYTQLPMSELLLFGRPQDYGYAQADPLRVIASRHHFRIWKTAFQVQGETLWAGAGTHDIGLEKDQRNGKLTHKIDPEVDKERDYIGATLQAAGAVAKLVYLTPSLPVKEAKTATGGSFRSDGRTLVVILNPDLQNKNQDFANLFCSVLKGKNPDGGDWGECTAYLDTAPNKTVPLGPLPDKYRLLIVPGLLNTCFAGAPAFKEGQAYLKDQYGLTVELLPLPNDSSEDNARLIADYLRTNSKGDARKYILLGYSKGVPDLQVALAQEAGLTSIVAAVISVAGASGGSAVADAIPGYADRWIRSYKLPNCQGDLSQGLKSLSRSARQAFLSRYPNPPVPTYSLPAVSERTNTSQMLLQSWQVLSALGDRQDGQLTRNDAIVPGSKYLGSALADHFAIALPFETSNESVRSTADKNHFPRTALLEALVRFVIQDLEAP